MTANPSGTIPDAARIFAAASWPRHVGAYSDAEPPQLDETSKALQTIAKAMAAKDEAAGQDRGKVAAIGKVGRDSFSWSGDVTPSMSRWGQQLLGKNFSTPSELRPLKGDLSSERCSSL